ncbi:MAG: glycosyltransferase [Bacteroidota bacterium]
MESEPEKRVLLSPLAWGLGHATRIIPIINELSKKGYQVTVATNQELGALIKNYCPYSEIIDFYSPKMRLKGGKKILIHIFSFLLKLPIAIAIEHIRLKRLLKDNTYSLIVSDNRYGFRSKNVKSVIITHQLRVIPPKPFGFLKLPGEKIIKHLLSKFDEVWIPDFNDKIRIAGILSEPNELQNLRYIGPLSRFFNPPSPSSAFHWDVAVIASGPEPQKSEFIKMLKACLLKTNLRCLILKGNPLETNRVETIGNITVVGILDKEGMAQAINNSKLVISRSGYSTIMDLLYLNKGAILVPTPGQTEQEYLAQRMNELGWFKTIVQNDFPEKLISILQEQEIPLPPHYKPEEILDFIN